MIISALERAFIAHKTRTSDTTHRLRNNAIYRAQELAKELAKELPRNAP